MNKKMVDIVGRIHDTSNKPIIDDIMVEAFEHNLFEFYSS